MTQMFRASVVSRWLALMVSTLTVAACGGGGTSQSAAATSATSSSPPMTSNTPPAVGDATRSWTAPDQNTDGSPLTNLAGYLIYYGAQAADLTQVIDVPTVGVTEYVVVNLTAGTYYFSIRADNSAGVESALSDIVSTTIAYARGHAGLSWCRERGEIDRRARRPVPSRFACGAIAQLGERLHGMQEVRGSIPRSSTR
jgi:hypothetical protein